MKSNFGLFYVFFGSFYHLSTVPIRKSAFLNIIWFGLDSQSTK